MAEIPEINLPKIVASSEFTATDYLRVVLLDGTSMDLPLSLLRLAFSNVSGLQAAFDAKMALSTLKNQLGYINNDGQIIGSTLERRVVTSGSIDDCFSGFYTVGQDVEQKIATTLTGYINAVIAFNDTDFGAETITQAWQIMICDNGLFYRSYLASSSQWSQEQYVGGSHDALALEYAQLATLASESKLTPGAVYKLTDHGNDNGIILTAATSSEFFKDAIRLALVPRHNHGTYSGISWIGAWNVGLTPTEDDHAIFYGRVWRHLSGTSVGTPIDFNLDAVNWVMLTVEEGDFYAEQVHACEFDINYTTGGAKGYVSFEQNLKGNKYGEQTPPADGYLVEYNDWNIDADFGQCTNNTVARLFNNIVDSINYDFIIRDNEGDGYIYENNLRGTSSTYNSEIAGNKLYNAPDDGGTYQIAKIYRNSMIVGDDGASKINNNTIVGGSINDNEVWVQSSSNAVISNNTVYKQNGIASCIADGDKSMKVKFCTNKGVLSGTGVRIEETTIQKNVIVALTSNGYYLSGSDIWFDKTLDISSDTFIHESVGHICGSYYTGAGNMTVANGSTYVLPTVTSGCTQLNTREDEVTIGTRQMTVKHTGWYEIHYNASALCTTNSVRVEAAVHVNGTLVPQLYNIKTYPIDDTYINSSLSDVAYLNAGDVVDVRYKHSHASPITLTLGQINFRATYKN